MFPEAVRRQAGRVSAADRVIPKFYLYVFAADAPTRPMYRNAACRVSWVAFVFSQEKTLRGVLSEHDCHSECNCHSELAKNLFFEFLAEFME